MRLIEARQWRRRTAQGRLWPHALWVTFGKTVAGLDEPDDGD